MRVHVAAVPLVGFEAMAKRLGRLYPDQLALHTLVVLQRADGSCTAYDFLPLQPTSPATAVRLTVVCHHLVWYSAINML